MSKGGIEFDRIRINPDFITESAVQSLAQQELSITAGKCVERNLAGKNADGGALPAYKPSYQKAIRDAASGTVSRGRNKGRKRPLSKKGGKTSTTIRLTGDLHESYGTTAKTIPYGTEIALPGQEATKAGYLEDLGFKDIFAIGKEDEERAAKSFGKLIGDQADKALVEVKK